MKFPINSLHFCEISKEIRQIFKNFVKILYIFIKFLGNFRIIRYIFVKFPRNLSNSQEICQNSEKFLAFLLNFWEIRQKGVYRAFSELGKPLVSEVPGASSGRPGASWGRPGGVWRRSWESPGESWARSDEILKYATKPCKTLCIVGIRVVTMCLKCHTTHCFLLILGVFAVSWPTSRSGHLQKPFRNAKNPLFRRFWGAPGVHTGRVTGLPPPTPLPARGCPSSHYTPFRAKAPTKLHSLKGSFRHLAFARERKEPERHNQ